MDAAKHEITLKCLDLEVLYHHLTVAAFLGWLAHLLTMIGLLTDLRSMSWIF